ncbi:MAG: class I SAM-dependent methyltransferase [Chitinispirillaceae bacterium]|nr:class I SAM-dependent methyltransferase [Chitinispirillaceae bacterium]
MRDELLRQRDYWDGEVNSFDAIYSHRKGRLGKWLDRTFRKDMYERYEYTLASAEPVENRDFLDVGCGTGRYIFELVNRGCRHATGIDISEQMIEYCRRRAAETGVSDRTEFIQTDLMGYTAAKKFHVCIGIGLFDYIRDPLPVLKKMAACADDCAIMSFPRLLTWRAPVRKFRLWLRGCNVFFFTRRQIFSLLTDAGFKNHSFKKAGKLFCVTARTK